MRKAGSLRWVLELAVMVLFCLTLSPGNANAISRYTSTSMTCSAIKTIIRKEGAAILRWKSSQTRNTLYDRFVANSNYCAAGEIVEPRFIPSADRKKCAVYRCIRKTYFDDDDDWPFLRFGR